MKRSLAWSLLALSAFFAACGDDGSASTETDASSTGMSTSTSTNASTGMSTSASTSTSNESSSSSSGEESSSSSGETSGSTSGDSSSSSSTGEVLFAVTSPAFEEGAELPVNSHINEGNVHPQLDWVGAPEGTLSFAVFFHDESNGFNHSAIWNISADATGLPEDVEHAPMPADVPGAVQCDNWPQNSVEYGYGGPGSCANDYRFDVYALDVADLSGEITSDSALPAVRAALDGHIVEVVTIGAQTQGSPNPPFNCP